MKEEGWRERVREKKRENGYRRRGGELEGQEKEENCHVL